MVALARLIMQTLKIWADLCIAPLSRIFHLQNAYMSANCSCKINELSVFAHKMIIDRS